MIWILRRSASDRISAPAASRKGQAGGEDVERYVGAVSAYLTRMCGADDAESLNDRVLAELAAVAAAETPSARAVTHVARRVAFDALERGARRPRRRAERLLALHRHCSRTPGLLREKAESEVSKPGIDGLYHHLDRCDFCASMAGRCDLAEWHLALELSEPGARSSNGASHPRPRPAAAPRTTPSADPRPDPAAAGPPPTPVAAGPRPRPPGGAAPRANAGDLVAPRQAVPAGDALALWRQGAGAEAMPAGAGGSSWSGDVALRSRFRLLRARLAGGLVLAIAVGVGAVALLGGGQRGSRRSQRPLPLQARTPVSVPVAAVPTATSHVLRDPFVVGGVRLAVFQNPLQSWTSFERTAAGTGQRWEAVTVRARNLSMTGFDPRVLDYRLTDAAGAVYAPLASAGTGPARRRPPRPPGADRLVEARLGFRVPRAATGLALRFSLAAGGPVVVVPLGA